MSQNQNQSNNQNQPKKKTYVWERSKKKVVFVMDAATDRVTQTGLMLGEQGKYIEVSWGVYETDDKSRQDYLEKHQDFNGPDPAKRFILADDSVLADIANFRKQGVQPPFLCRMLKQLERARAGVDLTRVAEVG